MAVPNELRATLTPDQLSLLKNIEGLGKGGKASRWKRRKPPHGVTITPRAMEMFKLLNDLRYLSLDWLHAYVGGSKAGLRRYCRNLYDHGYLNRPFQQHDNANANYRDLIYELDVHGADKLRALKMTPNNLTHHKTFDHKALECSFLASLGLGLRGDPNVTFIPPRDILNPEMGDPITLQIGTKRSITPDGVFGLDYGSRGQLFAYEIDCDTESVFSSASNSIETKIEKYCEVMDQRLFRQYNNASTFTVLFLTVTASNARLILRNLDMVLRHKPASYRKWFAVNWTPNFNSFEKPTPAGPFLYTQPWKRAGVDDLYLAYTQEAHTSMSKE